jgi:Tol biopolymer transport system component
VAALSVGVLAPIVVAAALAGGSSPALTTRVSVSSSGAEGNGPVIEGPVLSGDGRWVGFTSEASNLVRGDTNGAADVFVHDRRTARTTRVSVSSAGRQANGPSMVAGISGDGRWVAFTSSASNLVSGDTNRCGTDRSTPSCPDVFVHDRRTGRTVRVSVPSNGGQANGFSIGAGMSSDGRRVVFTSSASNLTARTDPDRCETSGRRGPCPDVFVHDRQTGRTTLVSVPSAGKGDGLSIAGGISANGEVVVFTSAATNLVPGDTNDALDVFVRDLPRQRTTRVSVSSRGRAGDSDSEQGAVSGDGHVVTFASWATNLVPGDTNGRPDVFVHDRRTGRTSLVSGAGGGAPGNGEAREPSIDADGRHVAFTSSATNLVPGDTNRSADVFVHDRRSGRTTVVSRSGDGTLGDDDSSGPSIDRGGQVVAFRSFAANLVPGDTRRCRAPDRDGPANCPDVFVHQRPGRH